MCSEVFGFCLHQGQRSAGSVSRSRRSSAVGTCQWEGIKIALEVQQGKKQAVSWSVQLLQKKWFRWVLYGVWTELLWPNRVGQLSLPRRDSRLWVAPSLAWRNLIFLEDARGLKRATAEMVLNRCTCGNKKTKERLLSLYETCLFLCSRVCPFMTLIWGFFGYYLVKCAELWCSLVF